MPARADGRGLAVISCFFGCRGPAYGRYFPRQITEGGFVRVPCRRAKQNAPAKLHAANDYHDHGEDAGVICSCSALLLSFGPSVGRIFRGPANFGSQRVQWSTSQSQTFRDPVMSFPYGALAHVDNVLRRLSVAACKLGSPIPRGVLVKSNSATERTPWQG